METTFEGRRLPVSVHMDYIQKPPSRNCKIIGESGKITMDLTEVKVLIESPSGKKEIHDFGGFERNDLFVGEIDHFFKCLETRQQPAVTLRDGLNSLKIALGVKESMETGQIRTIE
jgi:predicted dehydrogenase